MSAWIETLLAVSNNYLLAGRTPRECVDWNVRVTDNIVEEIGRTPRECVDWNHPIQSCCYVYGVALLVSAWIETRIWTSILDMCFIVALLVSAWIETSNFARTDAKGGGRTPRECVDWNFIHSCGIYAGPRRTPRECVDWNSTHASMQTIIPSRTPRECVDWNDKKNIWNN